MNKISQFIYSFSLLAGDVFPDANLNPKTPEEAKENIEKVLKFMQKKSIKMHQTTTSGNFKNPECALSCFFKLR